MKEKSRATPPRRAVEEVAPLEGVVVPVVRCPFCRDAIVAGDRAKLACNACMAWHHTACWTEHGRCAGCGGAESGPEPVTAALAARPVVVDAATDVPRSHVPDAVNPIVAGWLVVVLGGACTVLTLLLAARGLTANARPSDALFLLPAALSALLTAPTS